MKVILLLALLWTSSALVLSDNSCSGASCQTNLENYISSMSFEESITRDGNAIVFETLHPKPPADADGLAVLAYSIDDTFTTQRTLDNLYGRNSTEKVALILKFTIEQFKSSPACTALTDDSYFFTTKCNIAFEYTNNAKQTVVKRFYKQLITQIPLTTYGNYTIKLHPIYKDGCDCSLVPTARYTAKIYKDLSCVEPLESGDVLQFAQTICLELIATDDITKNYKFITTSVKASYTNSANVPTTNEIIGLTSTGNSLTDACENGKAYAFVQLFFVGKAKLSLTAILGSCARLLPDGRIMADTKPQGVLGEFTQTIEVVMPTSEEPSFASTAAVSVLGFLPILMLFL